MIKLTKKQYRESILEPLNAVRAQLVELNDDRLEIQDIYENINDLVENLEYALRSIERNEGFKELPKDLQKEPEAFNKELEPALVRAIKTIFD